MPDFLTTPVPHSEGAAFIRSKPAVTRAIFDALAPDLQARAFVITGVEALDVVARVRDLAARLPDGGDYDELKQEILAELSPWLVTSSDPDERAKEEAAARRRAELLLRMHGWQAYARTQHAMIMANQEFFPFCEYLSSEDERVRPTHAALHGKIIPTNHPFWETHTPPWEFGCRCDKVGRTAEDVDEIRAGEEDLPLEERRVLNAYQLDQLNQGLIFTRGKDGSLGWMDVRTPRERNGTGYEWRPGDDPLTIDQILERKTAEEREAFQGFAGNQVLDDGRTLLEWWQPGAAGQGAAGAPPTRRAPEPVVPTENITTEDPQTQPAPQPTATPKPLPAIAQSFEVLSRKVGSAWLLLPQARQEVLRSRFAERASVLAKANAVTPKEAAEWLARIGPKPKFAAQPGRVLLPAKDGVGLEISIVWPFRQGGDDVIDLEGQP